MRRGEAAARPRPGVLKRLKWRIKEFYYQHRLEFILMLVTVLIGIGILHGARIYSEYLGKAVIVVSRGVVADMVESRREYHRNAPPVPAEKD
jgi:hypothetical protein